MFLICTPNLPSVSIWCAIRSGLKVEGPTSVFFAAVSSTSTFSSSLSMSILSAYTHKMLIITVLKRTEHYFKWHLKNEETPPPLPIFKNLFSPAKKPFICFNRKHTFPSCSLHTFFFSSWTIFVFSIKLAVQGVCFHCPPLPFSFTSLSRAP